MSTEALMNNMGTQGLENVISIHKLDSINVIHLNRILFFKTEIPVIRIF